MEILPLKNVWLEDKADLGFEIVYLAHLKHLGLNVPEGVVVYPPKKMLDALYHQYIDSELFVASRERLKKEWLGQKVPDNLVKVSKSLSKISEVEIKKLWFEMLEGWFEQLSRAVVMQRSKSEVVWTGGYALFCGVSQKSGWIKVTGISSPKIAATTGELDSEDHTRLDLIAKEINRVIPVAVKVWWLKDNELRVVRVSEIYFDQVGGVEVMSVGEKISKALEAQSILATKILSEAAVGLNFQGDGFFRNIGSVGSIDSESASLSVKSLEEPNFKAIYRLGKIDQGVLEWMQDMDQLRSDLAKIRELRELSGMDLEVCLPFCRSVIEFKTVREVLVKMNFSLARMFWIEIATPENILNIDGYLESGIKGAVINVDKLAHLLQGLDNEVSRVVVPDQTEVLGSVVSSGIKKLARANCRVIIKGERVYDQELLEMCVKWGVWGVVTKDVNIEAVWKMLMKSENSRFKSLGATV